MFHNDLMLANVDQFSKFFHQLIRKKILYDATKNIHLTCTMLLHYFVKFENTKMLPHFHAEHCLTKI